jgi:hypothetical protein
MLDVFKNNGHCVTMDSAYMGDIMAMIGRDVWRINIVVPRKRIVPEPTLIVQNQ